MANPTAHIAYECPQLTANQQGQLHMNLEALGENEEQQEKAHQLLNVALLQGGSLPGNQAYLDGCSTVAAFKTDKYLKGVRTLPTGIKINCNLGTVSINLIGNYRKMQCGAFQTELQRSSPCMISRSTIASHMKPGKVIIPTFFTRMREVLQG